jgi:hypothetical protein
MMPSDFGEKRGGLNAANSLELLVMQVAKRPNIASPDSDYFSNPELQKHVA